MEAIVQVNWIVVLAAAVFRFALGAVWYAPFVFGRQWQEADGIAQKPAEMPGALAVQALGGLVMAYVLAQVIGQFGAGTIVTGAFVGVMMWVGFVATYLLPNVMFEKRPMALFYIVAGYQFVSLAAMGGIIAAF